MPETPNGLASMTQARERRAKRSMPPPRHPAPTKTDPPAATTPEPAETPLPTSAPDAAQTTAGEGAVRPAPPAQRATVADPSPAKVTAAVPRPSTVYLDESDIEFLELARMAGLGGQPRLDIAKSAVVRLALRRLREQMTVEEVRVHLMGQPTDPTKTGRKRR